MDNMQNAKGMCKCSHHQFVPFLIVITGVAFFMGFWGMMSWDVVNVLWPVLVIMAGVAMLIDKSGMCKCASFGACCGHC